MGKIYELVEVGDNGLGCGCYIISIVIIVLALSIANLGMYLQENPDVAGILLVIVIAIVAIIVIIAITKLILEYMKSKRK